MKKSFEKVNYIEIGERLQKLRGKTKIKDFAEKLGLNYTTYLNYEKGERFPLDLVLVLKEKGILKSSDWLLHGETESPQTPPRKSSARDAKEAGGFLKNNAPDSYGLHPPTVSDCLLKAAKVLESGTRYADALFMNIERLFEAVDMEKRVKSMESNIIELRTEVAALKRSKEVKPRKKARGGGG